MNRPRLHVFVLVDALGWNLLPPAGMLSELLPHQRPLRTILGFSSGAIPTLLTGQPPRVHGHWNLWAYDPPHSRFRWLESLAWLPAPWIENRYVRRLIRQAGRWLLGVGPGFDCGISPRLLPFFTWIEDRNLYQPGSIAAAPTVFDRWRQEGLNFHIYSYQDGWRGSSDAALLARAERDIARSPATVFFLYLSGLDHFLHRHRRDPAAVAGRLDALARDLRRVLAAARRRDPEADLSVASDHGMAPVERHFDLAAAVNRLGYRMPADYLAIYDSTMARYWFFSSAARRAILAQLEQIPCGRILDAGALAAEGVNFADARFGQAIFLLHPRWLATSSDFHGRGWQPAGMHGYAPSDPDSDAVLLTSAPPPAELTAIAGLHDWLLRPLPSWADRPQAARQHAPPFAEAAR
ncbi:MAG: alkaline phosphatase family protein [Terriglobales bacterium]